MPQDPVEALIEGYLARRLGGATQTPEDLAAAHPEHAEVLLRRLAQLARLDEMRAAAGAPTLDVPASFDGFEIVRELGRGGMGVVYEARQLALGRAVAIKVMAWGSALSPRLRERFEREITTLARISHPHIVKVFGSGSVAGAPYVAMELVDGEALSKRVPRAGESVARTAIQDRVGICAKVARALDHAHEVGVVHRDVKPGNVLIDRRGEPVLLDFGLARDEEKDSVTLTGEFVGTLSYTAPEQARGERVDRRADVYGLGATLYHLVTGSPPYSARSITDLVRQIEAGPPSSASKLNRALPRDLAVVLDHATAPDPTQRYGSCGDLADDLEAVLAHRPIRAKHAGPVARAVRFVRRRPAVASLAVVSAIAAVTGFGAWRAKLADDRRRAEVSFRESFDLGEARLIADEWVDTPTSIARRKEARTHFLHCVEIHPDDADAWLRLAECHLRLHDKAEGEAALVRAEGLAPRPVSCARLASEHRLTGRPDHVALREWIEPDRWKSMSDSELIDLALLLATRISDDALPNRRQIAYQVLTASPLARSGRLATGLLLGICLYPETFATENRVFSDKAVALSVALAGYDRFLERYPGDEVVGFNQAILVKDAKVFGADLGERRLELQHRCDAFFDRYVASQSTIDRRAEWLSWRMSDLFELPNVIADCDEWLKSTTLDEIRTLALPMQEWIVRAQLVTGRFEDARALLVPPLFTGRPGIAGPLQMMAAYHGDHVGSGFASRADDRLRRYIDATAAGAEPDDVAAALAVLDSLKGEVPQSR